MLFNNPFLSPQSHCFLYFSSLPLFSLPFHFFSSPSFTVHSYFLFITSSSSLLIISSSLLFYPLSSLLFSLPSSPLSSSSLLSSPPLSSSSLPLLTTASASTPIGLTIVDYATIGAFFFLVLAGAYYLYYILTKKVSHLSFVYAFTGLVLFITFCAILYCSVPFNFSSFVLPSLLISFSPPPIPPSFLPFYLPSFFLNLILLLLFHHSDTGPPLNESSIP